MSFLGDAVTLVGALCLLNLLLTLGLTKHLRDHATDREKHLPRAEIASGLPRVGAMAGEFAVRTVDGELVTRELLLPETVVAFFASDCEPCVAEIPQLVAYARNVDSHRRQILVAVTGNSTDADEMVVALTPVANVIVEEDAEQICEAFAVNVFPAVCMVTSTGMVMAAGPELSLLPVPTQT